MKYLDLTFADASASLACDEALLELLEREQISTDCLRVWEPKNYFVVLGHANHLRSEVNVEACRENHVAILRRISGGGTVLQGPGCLNYSLFLDSRKRGLGNIAVTFDYVLQRHRRLFRRLCGAPVRVEGISDLTLAGRKFSGNAQYRKSRFVLVHGTFLLNLDLRLMASCLAIPTRQPDYRQHRSHIEFVANLNVDSARVRRGLRQSWQARESFNEIPLARIDALVRERYGNASWSEKF